MFLLCVITCLIHALCLGLYPERCVGERSIVDNSNRYIMAFLIVHTGVTVDVGESPYITFCYICCMFFTFTFTAFYGFTSKSPMPPVHPLTQVYMCSSTCMLKRTHRVCLQSPPSSQTLAILSRNLSKLKHYINADYVPVCFSLCCCKTIYFECCQCRQYPEPTELFSLFCS